MVWEHKDQTHAVVRSYQRVISEYEGQSQHCGAFWNMVETTETFSSSVDKLFGHISPFFKKYKTQSTNPIFKKSGQIKQ